MYELILDNFVFDKEKQLVITDCFIINAKAVRPSNNEYYTDANDHIWNQTGYISSCMTGKVKTENIPEKMQAGINNLTFFDCNKAIPTEDFHYEELEITAFCFNFHGTVCNIFYTKDKKNIYFAQNWIIEAILEQSSEFDTESWSFFFNPDKKSILIMADDYFIGSQKPCYFFLAEIVILDLGNFNLIKQQYKELEFIQKVAYKSFKKTKIKCPGCGVIYEINEPQQETVVCMDCGCSYLQAIHNIDRPEFIRQAVYRCRGEK